MKKTVLITGASRGIGKATAELFATKGYNVVINYNTSESQAKALEENLTEKGYSAISIKADITNKAELIEMVKIAKSKFGCIDVLVNNAGISHIGLITETEEATWDKLFNVNVKGMYMLTNLLVKDMINNGYGKIVNVTSMWGIAGASCEVAYSSAKSAVVGYTKALAKELGLSNINVNAVAPGVIMTDMNKNLSADDLEELKANTSLNRLGSPIDVANAIYFLASDEASYITGQTILVDGGFLD